MSDEHFISKKIAILFENNIKEKTLGKEITVAFSGGVDSTAIAHIAKKYAKKITLYSVGTANSEDIFYSFKLAKELNLPLQVYLLEKQELKLLYKEVESKLNLGFLKSEILAPILKLFKEAKEKTVLFGSGSEEVFLGYERYYQWIQEKKSENEINILLEKEFHFLNNGGDITAIKALAKVYKKEALFPFYDENLKQASFSSSITLRAKDPVRKKYLFRKAASILKVPKLAVLRKKKALQYGSNVHNVLLKMHKKHEI